VTGQDYSTIARVIRDPPYDRFVVAERFAAMFAKEDPQFNQNRFFAAALWGIEQRADGAVAGRQFRCQTRRAPTQAVAARIELGH